jgi:hypothetical protein
MKKKPEDVYAAQRKKKTKKKKKNREKIDDFLSVISNSFSHTKNCISRGGENGRHFAHNLPTLDIGRPGQDWNWVIDRTNHKNKKK